MVSHHSAKSGGQRHCGNGDIMFLVVQKQEFTCFRTYLIRTLLTGKVTRRRTQVIAKRILFMQTEQKKYRQFHSVMRFTQKQKKFINKSCLDEGKLLFNKKSTSVPADKHKI